MEPNGAEVTSTRLLVSQLHSYPDSVCFLCDSDLLRVEPLVSQGEIFPLVQGEILIRAWLYEDNTPPQILEFVRSALDDGELKAAFETLARPLRRPDPYSVPSHRKVLSSVSFSDREKAVWDHISDRITQYLECDGVFPLVTRVANEAVAVAFRFNRAPDRQGAVYDLKKEIVEWSSYLKALAESGPFWSGVEIFGALPIDAEDEEATQQIGASLGLALVLARERKRANVLGYWPPLDIMATGAFHSGKLCRVESVVSKRALAERLGARIVIWPKEGNEDSPDEAALPILGGASAQRCVKLVREKLEELDMIRITFHEACLGVIEAQQLNIATVETWQECDVIYTRLSEFHSALNEVSNDSASTFAAVCDVIRKAVAARRRRLHYTKSAAIGTVCVCLAVFAMWLWQENRKNELQRRNQISRLTEEGRQEFLRGSPLRSLPYLEKAYRMGGDSQKLKFLLARGLEGVAAQVSVLGDPSEIVRDAEFMPDSARILTLGAGDSLALWDARSGSRLSRIVDFVKPGFTPAVNIDGSMIASATENVGLIWNGIMGDPVRKLEGHEFDIKSITFSPDGSHVATASVDDTSKIWSAKNGSLIHTLVGHTATVQQAVFDHVGEKVVTLSLDRTIRVWETRSGASLQTFRLDIDEFPFSWFVTARVEVSPNGKYLIAIFGSQILRVWDLESSDLISDVGADGRGFYAVNFDLVSGEPVAVMASDERTPLNLVNLISNEPVTFATTEWMTSAVVNSTGTRAITTGFDQNAEVWDLLSGHVLFRLEGHRGSAVTSADFSDDDSLMLTVDWNGTARVWKAKVGMLQSTVRAHSGKISSISFDKSGSRFVTAGDDNQLNFWSFDPISKLTSISSFDAPLGAAVINAEGSRAVSVSELMPFPQEFDPTARIWDLKTGEELLALKNGHTNSLSKASFDIESRDVFTVSWSENKINRWDSETGEYVDSWRVPTTGSIVSVTSFGHEERPVALTSEKSGAVLMWDLPSLSVTSSFEGHRLWCQSARFNPSGTRLVTGSGDMNAKIWEVESGSLVFTLEGHRRMMMDAQFSPNGSLIATGGHDEGVMVWDADSGELLADLRDHGNGLSAFAFHPSGKFLLTATDGYIKCWDVSHTQLKPAEVTSVVRSNVPWKLVEDTYLHRNAAVDNAD